MRRVLWRKVATESRGFTLIELLIVVAILGIVAAIIVPNLLSALQKAKQKRTMSDMNLTGAAWMSWLTDQVSAQAAGSAQTPTPGTFAWTSLSSMTHSELAELLVPQYAVELPANDGWGYEYEFAAADNLFAVLPMAIRTPGNDGTFEGDSYQVGSFVATNFEYDIVWAGGFFVRWPNGLLSSN